jgi:hypothetical protein
MPAHGAQGSTEAEKNRARPRLIDRHDEANAAGAWG